ALVGQKVAIVTPRPQTTRTRILGIRTLPDLQVVLIDTPGLHQARSLLNRRMVDVARTTLAEADMAVLVVDVSAGLTGGDREIAEGLAATHAPTAVVLDEFTEKPEKNVTVIRATILVDRENHKPIVLGNKGERIKEIGTVARQEIEALLGTKIFLELFVRVEPNWSENPRRLSELG